MSQKIRIKLKSYDYSLVDKSAEKIVKTVKATGAIVSGPIPLPTHKRIFTVNRSTFVNKKSREQFELSSYKRLIDIYSSTAKTVDALMKLELPSGVDIEIKFIGLRPGEKLYEEMLMKEEGMQTTPNKMIHIGKPIELSHDFFDQLEDLRQSAFDEDSDIRKDVQHMVDTYHYDENTTHGVK